MRTFRSPVCICLFVCFLALMAAQVHAGVVLTTDKPSYNPGDPIVLTYSGFPGNQTDWITIVPIGTSVEDWGDWFYTEGKQSGTHTFSGLTAGEYEIRAYFNWSAGGFNVQGAIPVVVGKAATQTPAAGNSLTLDQASVPPGGTITVNFTSQAGLPNDAWVGIIPSGIPHGDEATNDQHDVAYQYLEGKTSGSLVFQAPSQPGPYDFRMHDTDGGGVELVSVSFTVGQAAASLTLPSVSVAPGGSITVNFTADASFPRDAWVGIIPSDVPHGDEATNDGYDLAYQYLEGKTSGSLVFTAPSQPGQYDFRMHDTDGGGVEVASATFTVGQGSSSLVLPKTVYAPGEAVVVTFTAAPSFPTNAWVGLIPSNIPHGDEATNDQHDLSYFYLDGKTSGTLTFTAPHPPGQYDLRMHDTDSDGVEVTSVTFTVQ